MTVIENQSENQEESDSSRFQCAQKTEKRSYSDMAEGKVDEISRKELEIRLKEEREKKRKLEQQQR